MTQNQYPQQQYPYPQPPVPPKKTHKFRNFVVLPGLAVVAIIVIAVSTSGGGSSTSTTPEKQVAAASPSTADKPAPKPKTAHLGDTVKSGDWTLKATSTKTTQSAGDNPYLTQKAQGIYHVVHMTVTNTGDTASTFIDSDVKLLDSKGREYSPDSMAEISASPNGQAPWLNQVNPGSKVTGDLYYDVPESVKPVAIKLDGGIFSKSATISLTK